MTKARDLADLGNKTSLDEINDAYDAGALSNRNLIINGSMAISQRNGPTLLSPAPSGYGSADRFATFKSGAGTFSIQQSTDSPSGFINSIKATVTSASTPSGTNYYHIQHTIEGQNFASLAQGTSDAKTFTLSFYVKSSITGTFSGSFRDSTPSISYVFEYTVNSANTWERKTITVDGTSSGTFSTDNNAGAYLAFSLGQGTTFGSSTVGSWHSGNYHGSSSETKFIANAGATFQITGVQVEVGDTATPFEHKNARQELSDCQRYCWRLTKENSSESLIAVGFVYSTSSVITHLSYPQVMRAIPSASVSSVSHFQVLASGGGWQTLSSINYGLLKNSGRIFCGISNAYTTGTGSELRITAGHLLFDAEL
jgi:hypothetical protein